MEKKTLLFSTALIGFVFLGCSREIIIPVSKVKKTEKVPWQQNEQKTVDKNIDTSNEEHIETLKDDTVISPAVSKPVEVITSIKKPKISSPAQSQTKKMERVPFPMDEYKALNRTGKGRIKGSIYVKKAYKKIFGKYTRLYLNPITSYSKQWYTEGYISGYKMEKADKRLFNYLRFTASDNEGKFTFHGVPNGSYYLIGTVKCGSECGFDTMKNIRIAGEVSISGNQVIKVDLNRMVD